MAEMSVAIVRPVECEWDGDVETKRTGAGGGYQIYGFGRVTDR